MNHTQILKRAWSILWSYKMLWVFGILLALASGGGGNPSNYNPSTPDFNQPEFNIRPEQWDLQLGGLERLFSDEMVGFWIGLGVALVCLVLLLAVVFTILKYVSRVALIQMVDGYETTGEKASFRQGFRLGWSREAWRLFLIDLAIGIPLALVFIVLFGCAMTPMIATWIGGSDEPGWTAIMPMIGMTVVLLFLLFIVSVALSLVMNLIQRACVMDGAGVIDSIRLGVRRLRERFKDVVIMWLILIGIGIAYAIAIIPVALLLFGVGLVAGGGVGLATYAGLNAVASQMTAIILAAILGFTLLFTIMGVPLTFLEGLRQTYFSTAWTLVYRELQTVRVIEAPAEGEPLPSPAGGPVEEALPPASGEEEEESAA
jgi:hypothetical protein